MFGDFMNVKAKPEERVYVEVKSVDEMYKTVEKCLEEYNTTRKDKMDIIVFRYGTM